MKKICANCQYYRAAFFLPHVEHPFCSNTKSPFALTHFIKESDTCPEFYQRGKKAPLPLRVLNKAMGKVLEGLRK